MSITPECMRLKFARRRRIAIILWIGSLLLAAIILIATVGLFISPYFGGQLSRMGPAPLLLWLSAGFLIVFLTWLLFRCPNCNYSLVNWRYAEWPIPWIKPEFDFAACPQCHFKLRDMGRN